MTTPAPNSGDGLADGEKSLSELAYEALVEEYGQGQDRRQVGYFRSQSLKKLVDALDDPEQIQQLQAERRVDRQVEDLFGGEEVLEWLNADKIMKRKWRVGYDRAIHPRFNWEELSDRLADNPDVFDFPINHVVIRIDDDGLRDHWVKFIRAAMKRHPQIDIEEFPEAWIKPPFFAVMSSQAPENGTIKDLITDYHSEEQFYFKNPDNGGERRGLGWRPRALDLDAIWSYRAFIDKTDIVATQRVDGEDKITRSAKETSTVEQLTPRKLEDRLINAADEEQPYVTGINAPLFVSKWSGAFREGTERKAYLWDERGEWVLSDGGE